MPTAQEFLGEPPLFILLVNGMPDSGKSDLLMTFPDVYVITFDPTGFNILKTKTERAAKLASNLKHIEMFAPPEGKVARMFRRTEDQKAITSAHRDSLYGCLKHVEELAQAGTIKTLGFDGLNYFVAARWGVICADPKNQNKDGELDRFAAYRDLKLYLNSFMWSELLPMATRLKLNLIVTCHIKRESEEAIQGAVNKQTQLKAAGKVSHDSDLAPIIEGSFRNEIDGRFGAVIYLEHKLSDSMKPEDRGKIRYWAYCQKTQGLDTVINAKNKYGLPPRLSLTGKSFYEELLARTAGLPLAASVEAPK